LNVVTFGSASEYLQFAKPDLPGCLILDVDLPDINGLDLQGQMAGQPHPQIVFITDMGTSQLVARSRPERWIF